MYIARILYPVETLGPGKRVAIWTCGCPRRCEGCSNPELWELENKKDVSMDVIKDLIEIIAADNTIDGFTVTGGEPFYQYSDLKELISFLSKKSDDILVFTGYYLEELKDYSLKHIAVLVDGPYIKEKNHNLILRGSDNQNIHILNHKYDLLYQEYLKDNHSKIQNFFEGNSLISVGIHKSDYSVKLDEYLIKRGVVPGGAEE